MEEKKSMFSPSTWLIIAVAGIFDAFQLVLGIPAMIPVVGLPFSILCRMIIMIGYATIILMFKLKGIDPFFGKRTGLKWGIFGGSLLAEMLPLAGVFPWLSFYAWRVVVISRKKE